MRTRVIVGAGLAMMAFVIAWRLWGTSDSPDTLQEPAGSYKKVTPRDRELAVGRLADLPVDVRKFFNVADMFGIKHCIHYHCLMNGATHWPRAMRDLCISALCVYENCITALGSTLLRVNARWPRCSANWGLTTKQLGIVGVWSVKDRTHNNFSILSILS